MINIIKQNCCEDMVLFINYRIARGGRGVSQKMANDDMGGGEWTLFMNSLYIITTCLPVFVFLRCCPVGYVVNV